MVVLGTGSYLQVKTSLSKAASPGSVDGGGLIEVGTDSPLLPNNLAITPPDFGEAT